MVQSKQKNWYLLSDTELKNKIMSQIVIKKQKNYYFYSTRKKEEYSSEEVHE